jgi:hypothetical protein
MTANGKAFKGEAVIHFRVGLLYRISQEWAGDHHEYHQELCLMFIRSIRSYLTKKDTGENTKFNAIEVWKAI